MRLYLAGGMRGIPEHNYPAFEAAAKFLRSQGHFVFNPAENTAGESDIRTCMAVDTAWICCCADGIAMLPGWEKSKGARAEIALAEAIGIPVIFLANSLGDVKVAAQALDNSKYGWTDLA